MTKSAIKRSETLVLNEAKLLASQIYKGALTARTSVYWNTFLQEIQLWINSSFTDSVILGYALQAKSLQRMSEKQRSLSLEPMIVDLVSERVYSNLHTYFEYETSKWTKKLRVDIDSILNKWMQIVRQNGYNEDEASKLLQEVFKAKGYLSNTARNIATVFRTGFYTGVNGATYLQTINNEDVWGYRYQTAGDEKVRDAHMAQQGTTLPKNDPFWQTWIPPNGYNCRCRIEYLMEEENIVEPDNSVSPDPGFTSNFMISLSGLNLQQ